MTILKVTNLGKAYPIYRSEWQRVARWFGLPFQPVEYHWILRNLNFSIQPGEAIGIIGQNGAGKSTLLKMLTGALTPSEGTIETSGRVSAILELGMGFNFELTGRQNAFFATQLMGLSRQEVEEVLPEIEAFAEIGDYFDQPMRTYSSGMQVRVAFAVATAYRPDILIVDEALSVGDAYFQHKCFSRIRSFQEQGTTLLFVSHDKAAVQALCHRAILLRQGSIIKDGCPEEIFDYYNALIAERENSSVQVRLIDNKAQTFSGTGQARILETALYNKRNEPIECVAVGQWVELRVKVSAVEFIDKLVLGYAIKDRLGQVIFGTNTWHTGQTILNIQPQQIYTFSINFFANLGVGSYSIALALTASETHLGINYEWKDLALLFTVINVDKKIFQGSCWLESTIKIADYE
jgi:lipopolysaccharide transport system ATP-binding protein